MQLSEYCSNVREVLKTAVQGRDGDSLDKSVKVALEGLGRCVDWPRSIYSFTRQPRVTEEIERTLRREANTPRTKHNKNKVKGQKLKLKTREILGARNPPTTPLDPIDSRGTATTSIPESGISFSPPFADLVRGADHPVPACGRLVRRTFAPHELPSLMEVIFSSQDEGDTIRRLLGDDEQAFVDVVDEARRTSVHNHGPALIETDIGRPGAG